MTNATPAKWCDGRERTALTMKQATIHLALQKEMTIVRTGVTPIEAMLLVAEHQKYVGGSPIDVDAEGNPMPGVVQDEEEVKRTEDEEINRLRLRYNGAKIDTMCMKVRNFPETYQEAVQKGLALVLPSARLSETKLV